MKNTPKWSPNGSQNGEQINKKRGPKIDAKNNGIFRARARSRWLAVGPIDNLSSTRLPTENQQKRKYSEENLSEHNLNSLRRHFSENLSICVNIFLKNRTFWR